MATTGINSLADFMPILVAANSELQAVLKPKHNLLAALTTHIDPAEGTIFKTINIPYPAPTVARDAAGGNFIFQDLVDVNMSVTLNKNAQDGFVLRSFEQATSPVAIRKLFLDQLVSNVANFVENSAAALITTTNYTTGAPGFDNTAGTSKLLSVDNFLSARAGLSSNNVNVDDPDNMSLVLPTVPYTKLLGDTGWTAATSVGGSIAEAIRTGGQMPVAFGSKIGEAQNLNALTTGSGTAHIYKGIYMHRYAMAVATAYLAPPGPNVQYDDLEYAGLPIRIMVSYDHDKAGWKISANCLYGVAVLRPECAAVITVKETP